MSKLILIESIDCAGKSTIAKEIQRNLFLKTDDEWFTSHEPQFDSSIADKLNFEKLDPWQREFYFLKDRILHQEFLNKYNTVLDRYYITGLAYAEVFCPTIVYDMCRSIYSLPDFKKPDLTFIITIDPELAISINESRKDSDNYNKSYTLEVATNLQNAIKKNLDLLDFIEAPYFIIENKVGKLKETIENITNIILNNLYGENNEPKDNTSQKNDIICEKDDIPR